MSCELGARKLDASFKQVYKKGKIFTLAENQGADALGGWPRGTLVTTPALSKVGKKLKKKPGFFQRIFFYILT